ncbi:hypothetical protein [Aeromicrobium fastidiosum]|uniref:Uncharacterized protein n=1 Tax=Aeromicrobium fastidiosum TaxID=52699 RepID=A0A641AU98_9ACTN|nr:hypothetical protein [Aeromicrobium fastidiosum]KAA1380438.1 hypothetical protein ESP62_004460 [Aeromicrobium fastidiosum]MBP2390018.1 hypothetical protein [Aeromicrobium fastidiosum]
MRPSALTRSAIAVATLSLGSLALAAVPAQADTPSGISRDMVLTAAAGVRATPPGTGTVLFGDAKGYGSAANRALKAMVNRVCVTDPDGPELSLGFIAGAAAPGGSTDGVVVSAYILNIEASSSSGSEAGRVCSFGVLAPVGLRSVLTGTAALTGAPAVAVSGDVFATPASNIAFGPSSPEPSTGTPTFTASGNAIQSNVVKVKDKKTTSQKKAAKVKYDKRLKAAKKAYKKALDKAGSSKSKAAKAAWTAKKKAAKAAYRYAIAGYKLVTQKVNSPFSISAKSTPPPAP